MILSSQSPLFAATGTRIERLQNKIADKNNRIAGPRNNQQALLAELVALESQLHRAHQELEDINDKLAVTDSKLNRVKQSKKQVQADLEKTKTVLGTRLKDIYTEGRFSGLHFVLSSKDINTLICRLDYLSLIVKQDARLVQKVEAEKQDLERIQLDIEKESRMLTELRSNCQEKQTLLGQKIDEKEATLQSIREQQLATEDVLKDLQDSAVQIRTKMNQLQPTSRGSARGSLRMLASGYCGCSRCCGRNTGKTASGLPVGKGIVAVDPNVIPLGTKLYISEYGEAIAGDIGGRIAGNRIDLGFDSHVQAKSWGKKYVVVDIIQ